VRTLAVIAIAGVAFVVAAAFGQTPAPYQRVGSMSQLMVDIIYPTSDAVFYIERMPPKDQKEWNDFKSQALTLAEAGNLLMMEGRARDQGDWMKDAKMLVDAGAAAYKAAQAKDLAAIVALNDQLYAACVTCHEQYRPNYGKRSLKSVPK
jgi:hypothetical protein